MDRDQLVWVKKQLRHRTSVMHFYYGNKHHVVIHMNRHLYDLAGCRKYTFAAAMQWFESLKINEMYFLY